MLGPGADTSRRTYVAQTPGSGWGPPPQGPPGAPSNPGWKVPPGQTGPPSKSCHACRSVIDARAQQCPYCGVQQLSASGGYGKSRPLAILLALLLGNFGLHRFYLGDIAWGIGYLLFFWTGIPGVVAWLEALYFLTRSNEDWAREHGGMVESPSGCAIGCLWVLALLPFLAIGLVIALIFLGGSLDLFVSALDGTR